MTTKKSKNNKKNPTLSPEDIHIVDTMIIADNIYDTILGQLNIDKKDDIYRSLVLSSLRRRTKDHLVLSIWQHLTKEQRAHLRDFIAETTITAPFMELDDIVITFANLYPALMSKVYKSLTEFFKNFIGNFNKISAAEI